MSDTVLPDSRLRDSDYGNVVADWLTLDAQGQPHRIRLTLQPIFCFSCGKPQGYVPRDVVSWVCWMCQPCSEKCGDAAALCPHPDSQFWRDVAAEMVARFGHALTMEETNALAEQGRLGRALELLERESPYRKSMPSHT